MMSESSSQPILILHSEVTIMKKYYFLKFSMRIQVCKYIGTHVYIFLILKYI